MARRKTGYDAACQYGGKLMGRCTVADSEAYHRARRQDAEPITVIKITVVGSFFMITILCYTIADIL